MFVGCSESETPDDEEIELADSVVVEIGEKGGTVKAKGVSLTIPEGALSKDTVISIHKVMETDKVSLPKDVAAATAVYEFGPKGTQFNQAVQVQFDTEKPEPSAKVFFTKEGDETQFEQLASVSTDKKVSASTKHFSLGFVGIPRGGALMPDAGTSPGDEDVDVGGLDGGVDVGGDGDGDGPGEDQGGDLDASLPGNQDAGTGGGSADGGDAAAVELIGDVITVTSRTWWGEPGDQTWLAYQDGDGPWQAIPAHPSKGIYQFGVTSGRYGLAYVCAGNGLNGNVHYATTDRTALTIEQTFHCSDPEPGVRNLSGQVSSSLSDATFLWAHRLADGSSWYMGPTPMSFTIPTPDNLSTDLVIALRDNSSGLIQRMLLTRDLLLVNNVTGFDIDTDMVGFQPEFATVTVSNLPSPTVSAFLVQYTTNGSKFGVDVGGFTHPDIQAVYKEFAIVPENDMREDDRYRIYAADGDSQSERTVELITKQAEEVELIMPAEFSAAFNVDQSSYFAASMTFEEVPDVTEYALRLAHSSGILTVTAERAWFDNLVSIHTLIVPDLSAAPGFQETYAPPSNAMGVGATGAAIEHHETEVASLRRTSTTSSTLPLVGF